MNGIGYLLDRFWILKDQDKDLYYTVRHELREIERFVREYTGWRVMSNDRVVKLEKTPVQAKAYMGITEFKDSLDYAMFCGLLMYLEDMEDTESFLLSEFIEQLEIWMRDCYPLDWTMFTHRKSLIRMMQYAQRMGLVIVHEGDVDSLSEDISGGSGMLYENTGLSRYFPVNYPGDAGDIRSHTDFEKEDELADTERGYFRINRVYRRLLTEPAMYWDGSDDEADSYYLKNQRQAVMSHLHESLGGRLDIHRNAAFYVWEEEDDPAGDIFPKKSTIADILLLVCAGLQERAYIHREDDTVVIPVGEFEELVMSSRRRYGEAWSKEYREMDGKRLIREVIDTMTAWMMLSEGEREVVLYPAAFKFAGYYPEEIDLSREAEGMKNNAEQMTLDGMME